MIINKDGDPVYQALSLLSAGLDSTTVAMTLHNAKIDFLCMYVRNGMPAHEHHAKLLANYFNAPLEIIDLESVFKTVKFKEYIPGYRMFIYTSALALADKYDIPSIYDGELQLVFNHFDAKADPDAVYFREFLSGYGPHEIYHHQRADLARLYGAHYRLGSDPSVGDRLYNFIEPLTGFTKQNVIHSAIAQKVPIELTLTCRNKEINSYEIQDVTVNNVTYKIYPHCGKSDCVSCNQRKLGFKLAGVADPTVYMYNEPIPTEYENLLKGE